MVRVMIVEDQKMPRTLLENYVKSSDEYELSFSIENAAMAEIYCMKHTIDLILMDVCTACNESGISASEKIKKYYPDIKIIIITSMPDFTFIEKSKKAGVDSFWYKDVSHEEILDVMARTMAGESVYPDEIPSIAIGHTSSYYFTSRELEVLRHLTTGASYEEISRTMHVSVPTVKYHVGNMLQKSGFENRTQLAVAAVKSHLVVPDY